jgi:hypothetical protein
LPIGLLGGAISGGASLISGLLGNSAAQKAAQQQAAAGNKAAGLAAGATNAAQNYQTGQLSNENTNAQPYLGAGAQATNTLQGLLGPNGELTQGYAQQNGQFQAPTAEQASQTPGYQFQLQQGLNALQNSAAASGGLLSTGTAKNLENYAQGVASQNYQNTYNNALNAYQTNFGVYNTTQNNLYNRLFGVSQQGANSAANLNNVTAGTTNNLSQNLLGGAQLQGNDIMGVGNAQAAGTVGGANALNAGITGGANAIGQGITLSQLLGAQNASNSGGSTPQYNALPAELRAQGVY